jgi:hypothetical protein
LRCFVEQDSFDVLEVLLEAHAIALDAAESDAIPVILLRHPIQLDFDDQGEELRVKAALEERHFKLVGVVRS